MVQAACRRCGSGLRTRGVGDSLWVSWPRTRVVGGVFHARFFARLAPPADTRDVQRNCCFKPACGPTVSAFRRPVVESRSSAIGPNVWKLSQPSVGLSSGHNVAGHGRNIPAHSSAKARGSGIGFSVHPNISSARG